MKNLKNEQMLEKLIDCMEESGDTLFAIHGHDDDGEVYFGGDVTHVTAAIHGVLKSALKDNANDEQVALGNAIINAIYAMMRENSDESVKLLEILGDIYEKVFEEDEDKFETEIKDYSIFDDSFVDEFFGFMDGVVSNGNKIDNNEPKRIKKRVRKINIC